MLPGVAGRPRARRFWPPTLATTDATGYYRLQNLPPGTYAITAELTGFSTFRREGVVMRAGLILTVDIGLALGNLAETITVSGDTPMIETNRPTSVMNIEGELLRAAPITSRRLFSDALDMAPGVGSRNVEMASGINTPLYLSRFNRHPPRAFQLTLGYKF